MANKTKQKYPNLLLSPLKDNPHSARMQITAMILFITCHQYFLSPNKVIHSPCTSVTGMTIPQLENYGYLLCPILRPKDLRLRS